MRCAGPGPRGEMRPCGERTGGRASRRASNDPPPTVVIERVILLHHDDEVIDGNLCAERSGGVDCLLRQGTCGEQTMLTRLVARPSRRARIVGARVALELSTFGDASIHLSAARLDVMSRRPSVNARATPRRAVGRSIHPSVLPLRRAAGLAWLIQGVASVSGRRSSKPFGSSTPGRSRLSSQARRPQRVLSARAALRLRRGHRTSARDPARRASSTE